MGWFKSKEVPKPAEASEAKPVEARKYEIRKAPTPEELAAKALRRKEKWSGRFAKIGEALKSGVNYAFSVPDRVALRAGQARDVGVIGGHKAAETGKMAVRETAAAGKQVGTWAVEGVKDVGHGLKVAGEAGVGMGVAAAKGTYEAGRQVATWGKEAFADAGRGIAKGYELSANKLKETGHNIAEGIRNQRDALFNSADGRAIKKERDNQEKIMAKMAALQEKLGMSRDAEAQIQAGVKARCERRGIDYESLGFAA